MPENFRKKDSNDQEAIKKDFPQGFDDTGLGLT